METIGGPLERLGFQKTQQRWVSVGDEETGRDVLIVSFSRKVSLGDVAVLLQSVEKALEEMEIF